MALPKLVRPQYNYNEIVNGVEYKYKYFPYVNSHEVLLAESKNGSAAERKNAVIQILEDCIKGDVNVEKIPFFIIEHIFLFIHAKSVGEKHSLSYRCQNGFNGQPCGNKISFDIDFTEFKIITPDEFQTTFDLGGVSIMFDIPSFESYSDDDFNVDSNNMMDIIKPCINCIFDEETVYDDFTREELDEFMDSITPIKKIEIFNKFFTRIPHIQNKMKIKCSKCGYEHDFEFNSIEQVLG